MMEHGPQVIQIGSNNKKQWLNYGLWVELEWALWEEEVVVPNKLQLLLLKRRLKQLLLKKKKQIMM